MSALASAGTLSITASAAVERRFSITSWSPSGSWYYTNVNHFIGNSYPLVQVSNSDTNKVYQPVKIVSVDENSLKVFVAVDDNSNITVIG